MATVKSPALQPGIKYNNTMQIYVGECDHGPLMFTLSDDGIHVYYANREEILSLAWRVLED